MMLPRRSWILAVGLGLSGCVGASIHHNDRVEIESPSIEVDGTVRSCPFNYDLSSAEVKRIWGPPSRIQRISDSAERWTYRSSELRWVGIELGVLFPFPLVVPVGHEKVMFTIRNSRVTNAEVVKQDESYAVFGLIVGPCGLTRRFYDIGTTSHGRDPRERTVQPPWISPPEKD